MDAVSIALVTGPVNAGKAQVMLGAVRAHVAHGEEPLLVVPTEVDQARYRRELAEGGLALGARVERFEGLLSEVQARAGGAQPALGPLARERVLARLADARPGMANALARLVAEIETRRVTPARLRGALSTWRSAEGRASDGQATLEWLCGVFEAYDDALTRMRRVDRELRVARALDGLRRAPMLWGSTPVLLYGFDDLTELQLDTVETLGGVVGARVTVSLAYEPGRVVFAGRAATFQRLAPLAEAHTELQARAEYYAPRSRTALHHLERSLLNDEATRVEPGEAVRLLEGGSPRAELELVAGEVRALLNTGVEAGEIAIVHRTPDTIAGLLGEVLRDFDIPYAMRESRTFAHTAIGRGLVGLLRCALAPSQVAPGAVGLDETDRVLDGRLADLLAWLRVPGVLAHPELADRLEADARRQGAGSAERVRALWETKNWPLDRIDRVREAAGEGTQALTQVLATELQRLFCAPRAAMAAVLDEDELQEARALTRGRRTLDELRELARLAPEMAPTPGELVDVLEGLEIAGGERPGASRVAVVDPLSLRARRARAVFVCGLQEGVFPAPPSSHPLLGEEDRRLLAKASGLVLRGEQDALAAERYLLYALLSRPEERLTLSWHTAGEDGTPLARSLFVDDVCDLFTDALHEQTTRSAAIESLTEDVPSRPIAPLREELVLKGLRERALWSASSLESWAGCPVKWFVERLLRGDRIEPNPEPIARGGLAHAALKQTLDRLRERTASARLTPASVALAKRLLREALTELEPHYPLSVAPERLPGARRRLAVDLERYLELAAEQASPLEPTHLELEFGFAQDGLPPLDLGEGVLLRGRIDRVDVGAGGTAVVYDYKGRSAPPAARWAGDGAWQVALYMRAVERLLAHTPVGGFYQPLAGRDIRARGVLDGDSGVDLDCVRTDRLAHDELGNLLEECLADARDAARQAKSGALEPRPNTCAFGGGCAYPTICRCER
jgi:ATP-dependent helicase/DNAse subunit B